MTELDRQPQSSGAGIVRVWQRVPLLIRAIAVGFVVFEIGVVAWAMLLAPLVPAPWSVLAMGAVWSAWLLVFMSSLVAGTGTRMQPETSLELSGHGEPVGW